MVALNSMRELMFLKRELKITLLKKGVLFINA